MPKQLLSVDDLESQEVNLLIDLAVKMKQRPTRYRNVLRGQSVALIFEKPSTRTRISFEVGIQELGGYGLYLGPQEIGLGVREEVKDIARVLHAYVSGAVLRTFQHDTIVRFAEYFEKPVINGLSNFSHPCQALADLLTVSEHFQGLNGTRIAFVGDGNNVLNSLLLLCSKMGIHLSYATPKRYPPSSQVVKRAGELAAATKAQIHGFTDPVKAVRAADVVYTDTWVSMGEERQAAAKRKAFHGFQVNTQLLQHAKANVAIMHCLPAHRGEEIAEDVIESPCSLVFKQAANRLYIQKALLAYLLGDTSAWKK